MTLLIFSSIIFLGFLLRVHVCPCLVFMYNWTWWYTRATLFINFTKQARIVMFDPVVIICINHV